MWPWRRKAHDSAPTLDDLLSAIKAAIIAEIKELPKQDETTRRLVGESWGHMADQIDEVRRMLQWMMDEVKIPPLPPKAEHPLEPAETTRLEHRPGDQK